MVMPIALSPDTPSNYTGFGDEPNWSIKFGIYRGDGGNVADWESPVKLATFQPAKGDEVITQRLGRKPWTMTVRIWLASGDDYDRLDAMQGERATLRYRAGLTRRAGGSVQDILGVQYYAYPGTMLTELTGEAAPDGSYEATATFVRPYVASPVVVPPVWPPAPSPVPAYSDVVLATPGLRLYYRMAGASPEASVGPDTAVMTHTGSPAAAAGLVTRSDGAKQYTGTSMESSFTSSALSGATAGSMECWFKESSLVTWSHILEQDSYPASRFQIIRQASSNTLTAGFRDPVAGTDFNATGPYNQLALNHVVATFDGSFLRLYINGAQVASTAMAGFFPTGSKTFRANKAGSEQLVGVIDEVAVYNVALSPATILQHYQAGTT